MAADLPSRDDFVSMSLADQAWVCDWHALRDSEHGDVWRRQADEFRRAWAALLAEPRSALPEQIAGVIESDDFRELTERHKWMYCQRWEAAYRKRPKQSEEEADEDLVMADELAWLAAEYQRIEERQEWLHPDEWVGAAHR
jgi:hypothetical protein